MSSQRIRYVASKASASSNFKLLKQLKEFESIYEYADYFLKFSDQNTFQHLVVLLDTKRSDNIVAYAFKDLITNIVHYDISTKVNHKDVLRRLINEYQKRSKCTPKQIKEIFFNLP